MQWKTSSNKSGISLEHLFWWIKNEFWLGVNPVYFAEVALLTEIIVTMSTKYWWQRFDYKFYENYSIIACITIEFLNDTKRGRIADDKKLNEKLK